jgi:Uma2 family endonuclease
MDIQLKPITMQDILATDGLDEYRILEIVDGVWTEKYKHEATSISHGRLGVRLIVALDNHVRPLKLGEVYMGDTLFILHTDENGVRTMRKPDVAFVRAERVRPPESGYYFQAPDLAVEIISPSERIGIVRKKLRDYFTYSTRQVWLVYPADQEIAAYTGFDTYTTYRVGDTLPGGDLLPDFSLDVTALFRS